MSLGVFSITEGFIQLKTDGSLRRLQVTPISPISFLIGQSITRLLMTMINVITMVLIGIFMFGFSMQGDIFNFLIVSTMGIILFLGFGYAIAGWAKDGNQAAPLSNIIFFPMMFLSGTFFPRETFPDWLQPITDFMPLTYVADGLREIANNGATVFDLGPELLGISVWTIVVYFIAVKLFRWE
jgi:ABC-2 type transport system permease protein